MNNPISHCPSGSQFYWCQASVMDRREMHDTLDEMWQDRFLPSVTRDILRGWFTLSCLPRVTSPYKIHLHATFRKIKTAALYAIRFTSMENNFNLRIYAKSITLMAYCLQTQLLLEIKTWNCTQTSVQDMMALLCNNHWSLTAQQSDLLDGGGSIPSQVSIFLLTNAQLFSLSSTAALSSPFTSIRCQCWMQHGAGWAGSCYGDSDPWPLCMYHTVWA
jgi:hypothetical protein